MSCKVRIAGEVYDLCHNADLVRLSKVPAARRVYRCQKCSILYVVEDTKEFCTVYRNGMELGRRQHGEHAVNRLKKRKSA